MLNWILVAILCVLTALSFPFLDGDYGTHNTPILRHIAYLIDPALNCFVWPALTLIFLGKKRGRLFCLLATSVGFANIFSRIIKMIAGRPRPYITHLKWQHFTFLDRFQSFPSGHAAVGAALFTALSLRFPKYRFPCLAVAIIFPLIRVWEGKHHFSDVFAGEALGIAIATLLFNRYNEPFYKMLLKIFGVKDENPRASRR